MLLFFLQWFLQRLLKGVNKSGRCKEVVTVERYSPLGSQYIEKCWGYVDRYRGVLVKGSLYFLFFELFLVILLEMIEAPIIDPRYTCSFLCGPPSERMVQLQKVYHESVIWNRPCITELKTSSLGEIQFFNDNHSQGTLSVEISEEKEAVCVALNRLLRVDELEEILNVSDETSVIFFILQ